MNSPALTYDTAIAPPLASTISLPIAFARCVFPVPLGPWMKRGLYRPPGSAATASAA
jgi:hypothetical protein